MSNTVTSAFIDLATFDEIEKYLYNGPTAITHFVRCVRKSTWFAQVPVPLTQNAGNPDFNGDVAFQISRAGDYLLYTWLRVTLPAISLTQEATEADTIRWVDSVGHNLIDLTWISFNDLKVQEFDSYWLDMFAAHTVTASKREGYNNMVGREIAQLTVASDSLPEYVLNIPLPYFYSRDSGNALPTAALPYNEMRIHFEFRDWRDLLICGGNAKNLIATSESSIKLRNVQLWANYAVVSNEERVKMGKCPRDMVIEQVQRHTGRPFQAAAIGADSNQSFDIRISHAVKALFWNVQNTTVCNRSGGNQAQELSNYTTATSCCEDSPNGFPAGEDPVRLSSLLYENTYRLFEMGSDYFSLVQQFYHWEVIPDKTGYHSYSFALDPESQNPTGSTNFGKLTNVSVQLTPSVAAAEANSDDANIRPEGCEKQSYQLFIRALNFNIVRVSGGALGLPVL